MLVSARRRKARLARLGLPPYDGPEGAERAASTRDAAVAMGIDLAADLGLPDKTVKALFAAEATKAIDEGDADSVGDADVPAGCPARTPRRRWPTWLNRWS